MLRIGWCARLLFESVQNRFGFSRGIEEQSEGRHHWGEERRELRGPVTPWCAYGDVLVRNGEWLILVPFILSKN
jgi:hypothetical protein